MKASVDEFVSALERLTEKVEDLELRLAALEQRSAAISHSPAHQQPLPVPVLLSTLPATTAGATLATIGKVFLGIAGGYLLRALAESAVVPQLIVVGVALAYAFSWVVLATAFRTTAPFSRGAYALTSALILSPMLWELTVRFHVLAPWVASAILAGFLILTWVLAWKRNLTSTVAVASLAVSVTSLTLLVATRQPTPFVLVLLLAALLAEGSACGDRWLGLRPIIAVALDLALLALISIYTQPENPPAEYTPLGASLLIVLAVMPFVIYASGTIFRSIIRARRISVFETGQSVVAFLLASVVLLRVSSVGRPALGAFCLIAAATAYLTTIVRPGNFTQTRNYHVYSTWAAALFLAGSFLVIPQSLRPAWLAAAALIAILAAVRGSGMILGFHGAAFMVAAAIASDLLVSAARTLVGDPPFILNWPGWTTAVACICAYTIAARLSSEGDPWNKRLLRFIFAAVATYVVMAIGVVLLMSVASHAAVPGEVLLAVVRTIAVCLVAITLAFTGSHWRRIELVWLAYISIAFCTLKLLFEDMRHGSAASIAASLFFCGMAWVLVPRITRKTTL